MTSTPDPDYSKYEYTPGRARALLSGGMDGPLRGSQPLACQPVVGMEGERLDGPRLNTWQDLPLLLLHARTPGRSAADDGRGCS